jgi:hypothetical protein
MSKKTAFITDWAILDYEEANFTYVNSYSFPDCAFSDIDEARPIVLFGRTVNDQRNNPITEEFSDGHRIITSRICEFRDGLVLTENTIYVLGEINESYQQWCESNDIAWENFADLGFKIDPQSYEEDDFISSFIKMELTQFIQKERDLPEMRFDIGDRVSFKGFGDDELEGIIYIRDWGGAFGYDFHTYDILVEDPNGTKTLYKHIEEHNINNLN